MNKHILSSYGWMIVSTIVLVVILALASPLGVYVGDGVVAIAQQYTAVEGNNVNKDNVDKLDKEFTGQFNDCTHANTDLINVVEGACGVDAYTGDEVCRKCNIIIKKGKTIASKPHEYAHDIIVDGTNHKQICNICGDVKLIPHTIEKEVVEPSTCIKQGLQHVWCDICGYDDIIPEPLWPDAHSGNIVYVGQELIHQKYNCCNATYSTQHTYTTSTLIAATCTNKGTRRYTCACGYYHDKVEIDALGHNFQQQSSPTSTYLVSSATCQAKAVYYKKCTRCSEKNTSTYEYGSVASHSYTTKTQTDTYLKSTATCQVAKTYYYKCQWCTSKGSPTYTVGTTAAHNYSVKDTSSTYLKTSATCTASAVYNYKCQWCTSKGTTTYSSGSALGHNASAKGNTLKSAATCTAAATYYYECSRCGLDDTTSYSSGSALGHNADALGNTLRSAADCWSASTYYYECSRCGTDSSSYYSWGSALGHNADALGNTIRTYADCWSASTYYYECSRCGTDSSSYYSWGSALGHDMSHLGNTIRTYADCWSAATYYYDCTRCGTDSSSYYSWGSALGHDMSNLGNTLRSSATCTDAATYYYDCTRCGTDSSSYYSYGSNLGGHLTTSLGRCSTKHTTSMGWTHSKCGNSGSKGWYHVKCGRNGVCTVNNGQKWCGPCHGAKYAFPCS